MEPNGDKTKNKVTLLTWIMLVTIMIQGAGALLNAVTVDRLQDRISELEQKVTSLADKAESGLHADAFPGKAAMLEPR